MSASWSGSMRGPRVKTPFLLLLLLLLSALTGTDEIAGPVEDAPSAETESGDEETTESSPDLDATPTTPSTDVSDLAELESNTTIDAGSGYAPDNTTEPSLGEDGLSYMIILIPVVLVVIIIGMIVCGIFINRRWNKKASNQELGKEDPYLEGSSTEKVPMPMFEEDVPSVLELEMEELDQWMKNDEDSKHA
ncbi:transmembrane protein 154 isoform X1 [Larimichthys crocea]|uniref:transmembrane protein 154 isoform X1 n=1 Tax=Larimichthys crocea TaxID=215358 RepID=UPI000900E023|nr:transmembrane protein 154 isoform X1 [Larimichthys crocea]XP_019114748.1 transmembrane protein 154 isoform X1 [Larimichthys crocea]